MENKTKRLQNCASSGNIVEVKRLIEQKVDVNARDGYGNTVIHHAIKGNQVPILQLLFISGVDINAVNDDGCTALHLAVKSGREKCVTALLNRNAQVNLVNKDGLTELMVAMKIDDHIDKGHRNRTIEHLLNFPRINVRELSYDRQKHTALHIASQCGNLFAVNRLLEKDPALYNIRNAFGNLAIHNAAAYGYPKIIEELRRIFPKLDLNVKGFNSRTPLQMAVMSHQFLTIELLIELNADCNIGDEEGNTALHTAVNIFNCCCSKGLSDTNNCQKEVDHGLKIKKIKHSLSATVHNKCYSLALVAFLIDEGNGNIYVENNAGDTPLDLVAHEKLISNLLKSIHYQKLERHASQENHDFEAVESSDIQAVSLEDLEKQLNDFTPDDVIITEVEVTPPSCSTACGQKIMILESKIENLERTIKKMSDEFEAMKMCFASNNQQEYNQCGLCTKSATYSLLCGHKLCDDCYDTNSSNCITCNGNVTECS
ncbi:E3 ubiquitin-protein ligase MIB2-like protein [Leptotrombidium deliense]|uniref:Alpha-latrotoxin n=1 Tax=Leptotrombidium deliense TaxID=299467 RepID=A0A443S7D2_9ACAR|nr:E3 ubiquitin-protein ligase MIB2-like protein [Leptotrombidium deliense]